MTELTWLLDSHSPMPTKEVVEHVGCKWFTGELGELKRQARALKQKHNSIGLVIHKETYRVKAREYEERCHETKKLYFNKALMDCNGDQGSMYNIINSLLHRSSASPLPDAEPGTDLATVFSRFLKTKIVKIHDQLSSGSCLAYIPDNESQTLSKFDLFVPVTPNLLIKFIKMSPIKSCALDHFPA